MSRATLNFGSNTFDKAKKIVQEEYNKITIKSTGKVVVSSRLEDGKGGRLIIKSK